MAWVLPTQTRALCNKPRIIQISPEITEIWSKYCFDHISVISGLIWMILGLLQRARVCVGNTCAIP